MHTDYLPEDLDFHSDPDEFPELNPDLPPRPTGRGAVHNHSRGRLPARPRTRFYVQERPREAWHVESVGDCERMLCGRSIAVDARPSPLVQTRWGPRKCPECWILLQAELSSSR